MKKLALNMHGNSNENLRRTADVLVSNHLTDGFCKPGCPHGSQRETVKRYVRISLLLTGMLAISTVGWAQDAQTEDAGSAVVYELSDGVPFQSGNSSFVMPGVVNGSYYRMTHFVGDGVGYDDSFTNFSMFQPLWNGHDSMWFVDGRFNLRNNFLNDLRMGGNLGWGFRQFFDATGVGWGASLWWDIDDTHQNLYHQVGVSLERFGQFWDWRANGYFPTGNSRNALAFSPTSTQLIFVGNSAALARTRFDEAALKGFDMELGTKLYGRFADQFNIRAYGGLYHFQGNEGKHVWGGRTRIESNLTPNTAAQLLVTSDATFGNNVVLGLTMYLGSGATSFPVRSSNVTIRGQSPDIALVPTHRINQPVQRQYLMTIANQAVSDPVIQMVGVNGDSSLIHIDSTNPGGDGTFDNPFQTLLEAQNNSAVNDIIIAHAGSDFAAGGETIQLQQGQQLLGDGKTHLIPVVGMGLTPLPQGNPASTVVPIFGGIGLANDVLVSSVQVNQPVADQFGFFASGITTTANVNCFTIIGGNGIQVQNTTGTINFSLPVSITTDGTSDAFQIVNGAPIVNFDGTDASGNAVAFNNSNSRLLTVTDAAAATNVVFSNVTLNDTAGQGILIDNLSGNLTINGNVNITNSTTSGVSIVDSSGTVDFNADLNITNAAGIGLNINNDSGTFTFGNATPATGKLTIASAVGTAFNVDLGTPTINAFLSATNTNTSGSTLSITNTTAGTINLLEGSIIDSGAGTNTGTGILISNAMGTITVGSQLQLTETDGGAAIDVQGGSATINFSNAANFVTDPDGIPVRLNGGTANLTYAGNLTQQRVATALVEVTGGHDQAADGSGGTVLFENGILLADTGTGLQFVNADGIYNFTTMLNLLNNNVAGDAGIDIIDDGAGNNSDGVFTFTNAANMITSPTGTAFNLNQGTAQATYAGTITKANTGTTVAVTNHMVGTLANQSNGVVNFDAATINATNGDGLQFNNADGVYSFAATTGQLTLNGGDAAVDIIGGSDGTFTFGRVGADAAVITDPTSTAFRIGDGITTDAPTVTYIGDITQTTNNQLVLDINGLTGGVVSFADGLLAGPPTGVTGAAAAPNSSSGAIIQNLTGGIVTVADLNLGSATERLTNNALTINNNTGATINLTDVDIFTSDADAIIISNNASGTITFGDTDIDATGAGADGILISNDNPTSAAINFATDAANATNNLAILTTSGNGLITSSTLATSIVGPIQIDTDGTVNSTINTTGGQGVGFTAASTVVGTDGINFFSIQVDGSGSATTAAIQFDNVSGGEIDTLAVTVNNAAGTGLGAGLQITNSSSTFDFNNLVDIDDTGEAGVTITNNLGSVDIDFDAVNADNSTGFGLQIVGNATGATIDFLQAVTVTGVNANATPQADGVFVQNDNSAIAFTSLTVAGANTARRGIRIEGQTGNTGSFSVGAGLNAAANNPGDGGIISGLDGANGAEAISLLDAPTVSINFMTATGITDAVDIVHTGVLTSNITLNNNQFTSNPASIGVDINAQAAANGPLIVSITGGDGLEFIQGGTVGVDFNNFDAAYASTLNITDYQRITGQNFGVNIDANGNIGGTVAATVTGNQLIQATGATVNDHAFDATTGAPAASVPTPGGLTLDFANNTLNAVGGTGANLNGSATDSAGNPIVLTLDSFSNNDVQNAGFGGFVFNTVTLNNITSLIGTESTIAGVAGGQITGTTGVNGAVFVLESVSGSADFGDVNIVVDNATIEGVAITNSSANITFTDLDINGQNNLTTGLNFTDTNTGNLTVNAAVGADVSTITGITGVGVQITTSTNTNIVTLNDMNITSGGNALDVDRTNTGNLTLALNDIVATSTAANGIEIIDSGGATGELDIIAFGGVTNGIQATGVTNGLVVTDANFNSVTGTTLSGTSAGGDGIIFTNTTGSLTNVDVDATNTDGNGMTLVNASGSLSFTDLDITNTAGTGFLVDAASTVTLSSVNPDGSTINTTNGTAINLDTVTLTGGNGLRFDSITSDNLGLGNNTVGIVLSNVTGQFVVNGDNSTSAGGNGTGGTISSGTNATNAILLTNSENVTIQNMTITGVATNWVGIQTTNNTNVARTFVFSSNTITGGTGADQNGIDFQNNVGSGITMLTISQNAIDMGDATNGGGLFGIDLLSDGPATQVQLVGSNGAGNANTVVGTNIAPAVPPGVDADNDFRAIETNAGGYDAGTIFINLRDQSSPNP